MALTRPTLAQLTTGIARISDPITTLHAGFSAANVDIGFLMNRANGLVSNVALYWNETGNTFVTAFTGNTGESNSNVLVSSYAPLTSGDLLPGANVTYNLGSTSQRWKDLWLSGTTIYLGGASISSADANSLTITNPAGGTFTVSGSSAVNASNLASSIDAANAAIISSNTALKGYVDDRDTAITNAWTSNAATQATTLNTLDSRVDAANAAIVTANSAVVSYVNSLNNSMVANVTASNSAIVTANTAMKGYVDAVTTAWTSNAGSQQTQINTLQTQVYSNTNVAAYLPTYSGSIGTSVSTSSDLTVGGNLIVNGSTTTINNTVYETNEYVVTTDALIVRSATIGNIGANHIGTGTYLTSLDASNLSTGTVPNARLSGAYSNVTGLGTLSTLAVTGEVSVGGNLSVGNLSIASGNITVSNSGSFIGNSVTGYGALYAGIPVGYTVLPSTPLQVATNGNTYSQLNMQNIHNGSNASTDYVVTAGNGTDSTFYGDFGIASNTYYYPSLGITAVGANDTYLLGVGYSAYGPYTGNVGNVVISSSNGLIKLASGGANVANVVATVFSTGFSVNATTTSTSTTSGALMVAGGAGIAGNAYVNTLYTTTGIRWAGNGAVISTGGGGTGITYTASASAPVGPTVGDQWYSTNNDVLYEFQNVGTANFWVDITSPIIATGNITSPGTDAVLSPFLLMGA